MQNKKTIVLSNLKQDNWKRNAAFFIAGQFVSMFGSMLVSYAITWHITLGQQSGALMAIFTCAVMLPMVAVSPVAGVWADRYNRKYIVNISDAAIAIVTLAVALLYRSGFQSVWMLLAAATVRSIGQGIQSPAVSALIPQIVPEDQLMRFNGIQSASQSLTMFAAPMAAGALLTFLPMEIIFFIDVATACVGIATVFFCVHIINPIEKKERVPGLKAYYREIMEGLRFVGKSTWLKVILAAVAVFAVLASPAAMLTPLQVVRSFGEDYWRLTAVEIAFSAGAVLGGIVISVWGGFKNKAYTIVLACLIFGVTTLIFGLVSNFWIYIAVMVFCGGSMPLYNTPSMTLMQERIPPELMGRVFSINMIISGITMPLGMAIFGPLGDIVKIELLLVITGVMLIAGGILLFAVKGLLETGGSYEK